MFNTEVSFSQRLRLLAVNAIVFLICYQGASQYAASVRTYSFAFDFEAGIPFVPWMLLPYMTLWIVFVASFLSTKNSTALQTLNQSTLSATVIAGICFMSFPAKFSSQPVITDVVLLSHLQVVLASLDRPFNQLPSLHVAYAVILLSSLGTWISNLWLKIALSFWLCLSAISTIFTHQHHALDIAAGLALGVLCIRLVKSQRMFPLNDKNDPPVGLYYLVAVGCCFVLGVLWLPIWLTAYLCVSLFLVSLAYLCKNRHFLHKKNGLHAWWVCILYAPYLLGYVVTWQVMRRKQNNDHPKPFHRTAFIQHTEQLWAGRCLTAQEASTLPHDCTVIDLSPELRNSVATMTTQYVHIPILDIITIPNAVLDECAAAIHTAITAHKIVYVHCAMGFSRSQTVAKYYLLKHPVSHSML